MDERVEKFLNGEYETVMQAPCTVRIGRLRYRVRQVSQAVRYRIALLEQEGQILDAKGKEGVPPKEAKRLTRKLYSLHAKKAAYYLMGNWAIFLRPVWGLRWRILMLRGNEVTFKINGAGAVSEDVGFSKANWQLSRQERELFMRPVGEVAKEAQERMENVMNMLEADALGKRKERK